MGKLTYFSLVSGFLLPAALWLVGCAHQSADSSGVAINDSFNFSQVAMSRQLATDATAAAYDNYFPASDNFMAKMEKMLLLSRAAARELPSLGHPKRALLKKFSLDLAEQMHPIRNANKNQTIQSKTWMAESSHPQRKILVLSMTRIHASGETMRSLFNYLDQSPVLNHDTPSQGYYINLLVRVLENLKKDFTANVAYELAPEQLQYELKIAQGDYAASLSQGVRFNLYKFFPEANQKPLRKDFNDTLNKIEQIGRSNENKGLVQMTNRMHDLAQTPNWQNMRNAFKILGLLGSGDIEGSQADFENLIAVKVGFEMINLLYQNQ